MQSIKQYILNLPGWRTNRKIVVFESDDWGSIRVPSTEVKQRLIKDGIPIDRLAYNRFDALASEEDLTGLFEVLVSAKDKNRNHAIITANTVVANPDFEKIRESQYAEYHYEPFTTTLQSYPKHANAFRLWQEGIDNRIFRPQFHGREHINVNRWMRALLDNVGLVRQAFDNRMFDLSTSLKIGENSFMEALNFETTAELQQQAEILRDGQQLFESIFGYRSTTFIAPCYTWSNELEPILLQEGVLGLQGSWLQSIPIEGKTHQFKKRFHYNGQQNSLGQHYLVRNAYFEPADNPKHDWVGDVLRRASIAFSVRKPLIIGTHRLNYIGFIEEDNRTRNLALLTQLLAQLTKKWPDIEFMSSDQLLQTIRSGKGMPIGNETVV